MVKIREGLPLIDGQTTSEDSASLAAQVIASQRERKQQPDNVHYINEDVKKQLSTIKLNTEADRSRALNLLEQSILLPEGNSSYAALSESVEKTTIDSNSSNQGADQEINIDLPAWLDAVAQRINLPNLPKLAKACELIQTHSDMTDSQRSSAYLTGIGVTDILTYLYQDEDALVAAMLYRAARTDLLTIPQIKQYFGEDIVKLIDDTLAMGRLSDSIENNKRLEDHFANNQREQLSNIYSMLISMTNDVRVVLIKLSERTFAMRELSFASAERQQRVAREVMTIYAPLAHRLGIAQIKWELEDLAFRYLAPDRYKEIAKLLSEKRSEREAYIERVEQQLVQVLAQEGVKAEVNGRVKHIYSIYRKMKLKGLSFGQLYDIRALRVLVDTTAECYHVLGLVHGLWRHIPDQFDDYITNPKSNGYRSLHTAVIAENKSLEIQIRTHDMHFEAELGMCAHVNYKEGLKNKKDQYINKKISSLRQLLLAGSENKTLSTDIDTQTDITKETLHEIDEEEQLVDFSEFERIYVFSRDGDITELPKGATVLDFAYYVHTQVGNRAQAARVNQRYVPLTYQLKTGEQVEIITKSSREPNRDWLVASLGYIHTSRARSKLRQWFNKQDRDKNLEIGKQMLAQELGRLSVHPNSVNLNNYTQYFNANNADDILVGLVTGDIGIHQLTAHISRELDLAPDHDIQEYTPSVHPKATGKLDAYKIQVDGLDNIELRLANCCQPIHGEPIAGFVTLSNGVSIHNRGCPEYARLIEREPQREVRAAWISQNTNYQPVEICIEAYDRRGLLRDLTQVIDNENVNIRGVDTRSDDDNIAFLKFKIEITGLSQLSKLLAKLEQQPGVLHARRAV
ncbi:RelA/SpoT family protein [Psychrobacter sp. I-STPA10]|uniref:RelA/SpoT family protein n=1 Tax=Psychrobacter sp. I-STPA10 TaxID=2585769 RepID=UPI001E2D3691|nr:bifunctional (p)ppGpp synthetase/guanosine-3',5'-bis(diphosphate) 3'-pyrophosphohydrolase [Psychrobacter sp. I-STPA10]